MYLRVSVLLKRSGAFMDMFVRRRLCGLEDYL